jgi:hypothetical protein
MKTTTTAAALTLAEIARQLGAIACADGVTDVLLDLGFAETARLADVDGVDWSAHPERRWIDLALAVARETDEGRTTAVLDRDESPWSDQPARVAWVAEGDHRDLSIDGGEPCEAVVCGPGDGDAYRTGSGDGDAYRTGDGSGGAYRDGYGYGGAWRSGDGDGDAYRTGDGSGGAYREGNGSGNAYRTGDGDGDAYRTGSGDGGAYRTGSGDGGAYRDGERV